MTKTELYQILQTYIDEKYRAFHTGLVPGLTDMLGVRMPVLRTLAKQIAKTDFRSFLDDPTPDCCYEITMIRGIVISTAPMPLNERLQYTRAFIPSITNWALCDCFCNGFRFSSDEKETVWCFLQSYLADTREFYARFGAVMLLDHFITQADLPCTLRALSTVCTNTYPARMGVAWAVAECFVRFPAETLPFLRNCPLDEPTRRKTLQKILESRRCPSECRPVIFSMKAKSAAD